MTMLITVSSSLQPAPVRRHHLSPPPTLPKPGKDNLKLQRLLKKAAKKNAVLAAEHAKAFRSSLSPVNEASPDLEHDEDPPQEETPEAAPPPSAGLLARPPAKPVPLRISSPFRRSKPFTLKVTEQRRIAEHVLLTASSAMPLLQRPEPAEAARQPPGPDAPLPPPHNPSASLLPQPPPSSPPGNERVPKVTYVAKAQAYLHSFEAPAPNQAQAPASQEDRRPFSPAPEASPGQMPTPLHDGKAAAPTLEPSVLAAAEAEPPDQAHSPAATEESIKPPSPKPSDAHVDKPATHGSDAEIPAPEPAPQLPQQEEGSPNPPAHWRQVHPATAPPAQAGGTRATSTGTKAAPDTQPQHTSSLPNASPPLRAEPAPSAETARPAGARAGGWHRLRKHLMVQSEAPSFPEPEPGKLSREEGSKEKDDSQAVVSQDCKLLKSKATRMWDAILYQITLGKEKKQQQQAEEKKQRKEESLFLPRRLPILLHKPRFDARKLKELAAKPMTKISTVFEVSRLRPEGAEKHTKSFNRTASGWSVH